ncbi:septum formation protein Maf [bacterium]|nr:septum formation protein Maf [bacterium]
MRKLILASTSHWRKTILEKARIPFTIEKPDYEEDMTLKMPPAKLAAFLALGKAQSVAIKHADAVIVSADTFAEYKGELLGKPHTKDRAYNVLNMLSGKWHPIHTGIAVIDTKTGKKTVKTVTTKVHFRKLASEEIEAYVESGEPLQAGGSYTAQETGATFIDKIEGDFYAIVGLPIATLVPILAKYGIKR